MNSIVLIDTSVWINFFKNKNDRKLITELGNLLDENRAATTDIIKVELLRGTNNEKEYNVLDKYLSALVYYPFTQSDWVKLSKFAYSLMLKNIKAPLTDIMISYIAIRENAFIFHRDKHFDIIAKVVEKINVFIYD